MKTQPLYYEILVVLILSVIPWPGPSVFKISCPRDRASIVRKVVQKRWFPILKKYHVELPLECPFHVSRDIFYPQESAKHQHRPSQWTCGLCGKSFYTAKHLDAHFDNRHRSYINTAEDAVCLADYCDIMRCDVLGYRDFDNYEVDGSTSTNTDLQVWKDNNQYKSSVAHCDSSRDFARLKCKKSQQAASRITFGGSLSKFCQRSSSSTPSTTAPTSSFVMSSSKSVRQRLEIAGPDNKSRACEKNDDESEDEKDEEEKDQEEEEEDAHNYESALPSATNKNRCGRNAEIRWLKSNCKPEELQKLKVQCEILIRDCIAGLLTNLSLRDFQEFEGELNRAICWHLNCDRYWEDSRRAHRYIPWYLLITFLTLLSASLYGCYYVVWIVFNADDGRHESDSRNVDFNHGAERHAKHLYNTSADPRYQDERRFKREVEGSVEYEEPDPYIYVSYPPELKQRLLESCYNRTTRL